MFSRVLDAVISVVFFGPILFRVLDAVVFLFVCFCDFVLFLFVVCVLLSLLLLSSSSSFLLYYAFP